MTTSQTINTDQLQEHIGRVFSAGQKLYDHLNGLLADLHEERYSEKGGCGHCYLAIQEWQELMAEIVKAHKQEETNGSDTTGHL